MWKNTGKALLFAVVFVLLFTAVSPVFVPKDNTTEAGIHVSVAKGFLGEPENTMDVLFLGDSEAYSSFIPLQIWEEYGVTSYVCSNGDQMIYECLSYLERFLECQSPKIVVLETNTLYRYFTFDQVLGHFAGERFPYLRYHDRWKNLRPEDLGSPVDFTATVRDRGYRYLDKATVTDVRDYMAFSEETEPVLPQSVLFLERIRELCRQREIRLILVSAPSPTNWDYYHHNGAQSLAEEMGLTYIDMNLMPEEIPIDWTRESYDSGDHLNYDGARKVTAYMGRWLWETGLFTDKREDPRYTPWEEALGAFRENPLK